MSRCRHPAFQISKSHLKLQLLHDFPKLDQFSFFLSDNNLENFAQQTHRYGVYYSSSNSLPHIELLPKGLSKLFRVEGKLLTMNCAELWPTKVVCADLLETVILSTPFAQLMCSVAKMQFSFQRAVFQTQSDKQIKDTELLCALPNGENCSILSRVIDST
jgi:hypothetical protein